MISDLVSKDREAEDEGTRREEPEEPVQIIKSVILGPDEVAEMDNRIRSQADYDLAVADYERYRARGFLLSELAREMPKHDIYLSLYDVYGLHSISGFNKIELASILVDTVLGSTSFFMQLNELNKNDLMLLDTIAENGGFSLIYKEDDRVTESLEKLVAKCMVYHIPGTSNYCIPSDVMDLYLETKERLKKYEKIKKTITDRSENRHYPFLEEILHCLLSGGRQARCLTGFRIFLRLCGFSFYQKKRRFRRW